MAATSETKPSPDVYESPIDGGLMSWLDGKLKSNREQNVNNVGMFPFNSSDEFVHRVLVDRDMIRNLFVKSDEKIRTHVRFKAKQSWVGCVTSVSDGVFEARLSDVTNGGTEEYLEMELEEVGPDDRALVVPGAILYLTIGRSQKNGQVVNQQVLRFKRSAPWSIQDLNSIADRAADRAKGMSWDE